MDTWTDRHTADLCFGLLMLALLTLGLLEVTAGLEAEAREPEPTSCEVMTHNPCGELVPACKVAGGYARGDYDCREGR